jgi:polyhydroxyalkanoate synthesis regulator phasin
MMTEEQILKYGEIQYLKGRIDELEKAACIVMSTQSIRRVDARLDKYYQKLKEVDEISYYLHFVESKNVRHSKEKSKRHVQDLLKEVLEHVTDIDLKIKISDHINKISA